MVRGGGWRDRGDGELLYPTKETGNRCQYNWLLVEMEAVVYRDVILAKRMASGEAMLGRDSMAAGLSCGIISCWIEYITFYIGAR